MYITTMLKKDMSTEYEDMQFELHCLKHIDALRRLSLYLSFDPNEAEDLLQDTLLRGYRFFHRFNTETNCRAWLFKIMKNLFINEYRKKQKEKHIVSLDNYDSFGNKNLSCNILSNNPELFVINSILFTEILRALELLPGKYRNVILLADIHSYSYEEIASIINRPIGTVRSRLSRGRNILKQHISALELNK